MLFRAGKYDLELVDEPTYTPGSADNVRSYAREYDFSDAAYRPSSRHGLVLREGGIVRHSCILLAGGGASGVHEHSIAIVDNTCFVAVGDTLCSLALPVFEVFPDYVEAVDFNHVVCKISITDGCSMN